MLTEELGYTACWNGIKGGIAEFTRTDSASRLRITVTPLMRWDAREVIPQVHIGTS